MYQATKINFAGWNLATDNCTLGADRTYVSAVMCMELERSGVPIAHYLETRAFGWHAVHVLSDAQTLVLLVVLPAKKISFYYKNVLHVNFFFLLVETVGFEPVIL
jgi:hypothetical protein